MKRFEEGGHMKKLFIGISIFVLCLSISFSFSWAEEAKGPKMILEKKSFDFKEVDEGEKLKHTFKVRNVGDQPLEIKNVKPG
jgi:hypothetical protein